MTSLRSLVAAAACLVVATLANAALAADAPASSAAPARSATSQSSATSATSVTLLGTAGGPGAMPERAGIATLVTVGDRRYLVDAGASVSHQISLVGVSERAIRTVFLTHLHDDHTAGLPALMTFAYTLRSPQMEIIGPPGTKSYVDSAVALLGVSAQIRMLENPRLSSPEKVFSAREVEPGLIYSDGPVRVKAFENTHYDFPPDSPGRRHRSYSLRFETPDRTIVLTGDTGPADGLAEFAQGADVLIAEMASSQDVASVPPEVRQHMVKEHLSPAQVGQLATKAKARVLVLSHIRNVSPADVELIRQHYAGQIVVGTDLARF
jgi:ribonuclease BN (tRNA processing enzyme)